MSLIHAPEISFNDFFWSVIIIGGVITQIIRWLFKKAWMFLVHRSESTIKIWYLHKKNKAVHTITHANDMIDTAEKKEAFLK